MRISGTKTSELNIRQELVFSVTAGVDDCEPTLSRLQLASANRVAALTSHDGILWVQGIPNVKNR